MLLFHVLINALLTCAGLNGRDFHCRGGNMRERRKNFRVEWNSPAELYDGYGRFTGPCIVSNFSNDGAKIMGLAPGTAPDEFILRISPRGRAKRCRVVWRSKDSLGVIFTADATSELKLAVDPKTRRKTAARV
jgi:hypothetical protein